MNDLSTHYNILEVNQNSSLDDVRNKFKKLAVKYHPDKGGDKQIFNLIVNSFKTVIKDMKEKEDEKVFYELKKNSKQETEPDKFVVADDGFGDKFNKYFNENKTVDKNVERGYTKFIDEPEIKVSQKHYKLQKYKEPEGSVLCKSLDFQELGGTTKDFSGRNEDMHRLQYMDYQYAHTTNKLIEPNLVKKREEYKDLKDLESKRSSVNFELTNSEKKYYEKVNQINSKREQKRLINLNKYDNYLSEHDKKTNKLLIS